MGEESALEPGGGLGRGQSKDEGLCSCWGAGARSYRARSGGLANELCLLGREEVPSLMGDAVLPTRLVMLWQLLGREGGLKPGGGRPPPQVRSRTRGHRRTAGGPAAHNIYMGCGVSLHNQVS